MWLLLNFLAPTILGYALPADFILKEIAKSCLPKGNIDLIGTMVAKEKKYFVSLTLIDGELFINSSSPVESNNKLNDLAKTTLALPFFSQMVCDKNKNLPLHLMNVLDAAGVNHKIVSHGIFNYEPIYIIGADSSNATSPQLWVEKKTFLPIKLVSQNETVIFEKWMPITSRQKKIPSIITKIDNYGEQKIFMAEKN
jgi:hypothetical protein